MFLFLSPTLPVPFGWSAGPAPFEIAKHSIVIEIAPEANAVKAEDTLSLLAGLDGLKELKLYLNRNLDLDKVELKGASLSFAYQESAEGFSLSRAIVIPLPAVLNRGERLELKLSYGGKIFDALKAGPGLRFLAGSETSGIVSPQGVYLTGKTNWYPDLPGSLSTFQVKAVAPEGWEVVTQGRRAERSSGAGKSISVWESRIPAESLTLVAGQYVVSGKRFGNIDVYAYLTRKNAGLADQYIQAAATYIDFYSPLLGPYPFEKFAVVENFFPSGFGLPSFTLLGGGVIERLYVQPYALGHEIVHCWFGNYVLAREEEGSWTEAITTYLANYYYFEVAQGQAAAARLRARMLQEYSTYVRPLEDYPLARFTEKRNTIDQAIGYQKGAMVFHMLRRMLGDARFFQALRQIVQEHGGKRAGWKEFQASFEKAAGFDLSWFFEQWVQKKGAPKLKLDEVQVKKANGDFLIRVILSQEGEPYRLSIPVAVETAPGAREALTFDISAEKSKLEFYWPKKPRLIAIDPDYNLFRRLTSQEMPPNLNLVLYDAAALVAYPTAASEEKARVYSQLAERIRANTKIGVRADRDITGADLRTRSILILGGPGENLLLGELKDKLAPGLKLEMDRFELDTKRYQRPGMSLLVSYNNPLAPDKVISVFYGLSTRGTIAIAPLLFFYGWESFAIFDEGRVIGRGDFPASEKPFVYKLEDSSP